MTTIYLIRHAEAEGNIYRRCHGWYNSLITVNGYKQIQALERRFEPIHVDAVYASDLFRTMTTAGAVCKPKGLPLRTDPDLREIGCGEWEDLPWGELFRRWPEKLANFNRGDIAWQVEGSETYGGVQARMARALRRIADENEGKTVAVFSHGTAIRSVLAHFLGYPPDQICQVPLGDNTAVTTITFEGGSAAVVSANDGSHLGELSTLNRQSWWKKDGGKRYAAANLWFRPLDFRKEGRFYRSARREAWETIHHTMQGFDGGAFLADAKENDRRDPGCVMVAMRGGKRAGILQLAPRQDEEQGAGRIPFLYMMPSVRCHGLGVQLLGQAVSVYRSLGRQCLRLRCAPENLQGRRFYQRHGFHKVAEEPGGLGTLDVLEKYIGYEMDGQT